MEFIKGFLNAWKIFFQSILNNLYSIGEGIGLITIGLALIMIVSMILIVTFN